MDQNFRVGEVFADRFEIEAVMAETALGTLALVKDSSCGEQRLVEFLAIECDDARCDEIRHIASDVRTIQHKSIAGLKDFEVVEGVSCVEMEPVVGETLDNHLAVRRGRGNARDKRLDWAIGEIGNRHTAEQFSHEHGQRIDIGSRAVRQDVWIFVRDGVDYGPFDHAAIMKRFYDDEINESTGMFNTQTKKHQNLGSIDEFKKEIEEYLPTRDHNRRVKAEQELQKQKRVKAAGVSGAVIVLGAIAAFACVPFVILLLLPEPKPLDVAGAFAPFEKTFEAPKIEEVSLNMDDSKAKALFDPKATEAEREAALAAWEAEHRKKFAGKRKRPGGAGANNPFGEEIDTFVFTGQDGEELEPLSDWEIEEEVMSPRVYRKQADCFAKYAGGRGVSGKIDFVINQTGTTRSFSSCLIQKICRRFV